MVACVRLVAGDRTMLAWLAKLSSANVHPPCRSITASPLPPLLLHPTHHPTHIHTRRTAASCWSLPARNNAHCCMCAGGRVSNTRSGAPLLPRAANFCLLFALHFFFARCSPFHVARSRSQPVNTLKPRHILCSRRAPSPHHASELQRRRSGASQPVACRRC